MPKELIDTISVTHFLFTDAEGNRVDDYEQVIDRFNELTHDEKFLALESANFRGYLSRATRNTEHGIML